MFIQSLLKEILSLIFPLNCLGCGREDTWLCPTCVARIPRSVHAVPHRPPLDGVWAITHYDNPIVNALLHYLKYNGVATVHMHLGALLVELCSHIDNSSVHTILHTSSIIPVPLHPRRLRERGYNQSLLLAQHVGDMRQIPVVPGALIRSKYTVPQASLDRAERLHNIDGAFSIGPDFKKLNKNVILVDDVATTTATLAACATILKTHGTRAVWGFVIAHGNR
ncbi:MAG: ComF family protein [Candidatus Kerfeldbacteria bacterium]|nr:ComF family protein [Candidatus Kerfeldbacteria bacterium]